MSNIVVSQSVFSRGVIDEIVFTRSDTDIIFKSAHVLDNVLIMPQGGLRKSDKLQLLYDTEIAIPNNSIMIAVSSGNKDYIIFTTSLDIYVVDTESLSYELVGGYGVNEMIQYGDNILFSVSSDWGLYTFNLKDIISGATQFIIEKKPLNVKAFTNVNTLNVFKYLPSTSNVAGGANQNSFVVGEKVLISFGTVSPSYTAPNSPFFLVGGLVVYCPSLSIVSTPFGQALLGYIQPGSAIGVTMTPLVTLSGALYVWGINAESYYIGNYISGKIVNMIIYQNRLCITLDSTPSVIYVSAIDDWSNFINPDGSETGALRVDLSSQFSPQINNFLVYQNVLLVMTDRGIYGNLNAINNVFSNINSAFTRFTILGVSIQDPLIYDNRVFYKTISGKVHSLSINYSEGGAILDEDATLLCPSIFTDTGLNSISYYTLSIFTSPIDNIQRMMNIDTTRGACYTSISTQNINGWCRPLEYTYPIIAILSIDVDTYFIDSTGKIYRLTSDISDNISTIVTNPISLKTNDQDLLYLYKKIGKFYVYVYNTGIFNVNGFQYDPAEWNNNNAEIIGSTRIVEGTSVQGFFKLQNLQITVPPNEAFTLLGVDMEVSS